ncbi:MAG: mycofactocin system GMC family oxidoreductase MftG [SAR202 cluster bacterium]|nr:mycofactocin system GMC family oxidoreductase MftG [SAR202 cluster bacterium]
MKYDYIVVGAGSAGAIIATRLSEDPTKSVLLIEAGSDYPDIDNMPEEVKYGYKSTVNVWDSPHNWQYKARATDESVIDVPRGKVTGGSSSINGQIFLRGIPEDYDNWKLWGNTEWDFQSLVPYFNKIETDTTYQNDPGDFHGTSGPIICHRFPEDQWKPASKAFYSACIEAGYERCEDANAPGTIGAGPIPLNNPDGIRWSTAIGYLGLSRHRLNLTIRPNVFVKKIIFKKDQIVPKAIGLEVSSDNEDFVIEGNEIILCEGAIGTPQTLMLSGIGPKDHLDEHNIEVLLDCPGVGQNLRDHPLLPVIWKTKPEVDLDTVGPRIQVLLRYTAKGSSIHNDMIVYFNAVAGESYRAIGEPVGISAALGLNLALSSGEIKLQSSDYREHPYLDYNLLDHDEDIRRYRNGIRMLVSLEDNSDLSDLILERLRPTDIDLDNDNSLDLWIRKHVLTGHHVSCTAKMGPKEDKMAVVNQYGKVYGVEGLRIADASIMPDCVRANINVTVMVIAEKIADFIKEGK